VVSEQRPSGLDSIVLFFEFDLSGASELGIESMVLYLDDHIAWRKDNICERAEAGS